MVATAKNAAKEASGEAQHKEHLDSEDIRCNVRNIFCAILKATGTIAETNTPLPDLGDGHNRQCPNSFISINQRSHGGNARRPRTN